MRRLLLLATLFILLSTFNKSYASHIPGANITYTCDPNDPLTYTFRLTIFRLCPGTHPATMASTYFSLTNTCGLTNPVIPTFNQVGTEQDVNQLCATATSNCTGGTDQGVWMYTYEATITLPADCDSWTMSFDLCCRDIATNMSNGASNNMYTETTLYTSSSPCNDSPTVTAQPIPYACVNTLFSYCLTTQDPQGDSVYYQLITPGGAAGAPLVFNAGWSTAQPIQNFTFDPLTGCFSFNSPVTGNFILNIQINSYDSNGNLACSITHDFQVYVLNCTNTPPTEPNGGIVNFNGSGNQISGNTISACYGDNVCFDVVFEDLVDPGDAITIVQDGTTLLPGATFTQTGTNPATGTFCWTAQPGYTGSIITFSAEDDGCPVMGTSAFAVDFNIQTGVYAGPDPIICGSQNTTLQANGASAYTWSPGTGLSCTNCPNPVANPAVTTTYTLTGNLSGTCPNVDQVTVNVVPDFTPTMVPTSQTICANEIAQLNITAPGANGPYTYDWTPTTDLNDPLIANPLAQPLTTTTYTCEITSADGCVKTATTDVIISGIGPTVNVLPSDTTICPGETIQYDLQAAVLPVVCGPAASSCTGTSSYAELGTATTASSTYSPWYGSTTTTDYTKKIQMIYTAAELNALGYIGGTITDIAIWSNTIASYEFDDVEIWMGCTSLDEFPNGNFEPTSSMTQVWGAQNDYDPVDNDWSVFDIADWDWDGTSNLIVQFCSSEDNQDNQTGIESVRYSTTSPAYRMIYDLSSVVASPSCAELVGTRTTVRTNMRFNICQADVVSPTYSWSPGGTLSATNVSNPTASPTTATTYVVDVTANGCTGSGSALVSIDNSNSVLASNDLTWCVGDPPINLNAQYYLNGVPTSAATGANCYDQTITYVNPALIGNGGTNNFNFTGTPPVCTGGTLTINAYGDVDYSTEIWTIFNELGVQISSLGASGTQCGTLLTITIPLSALDLNNWTANGSIDFSASDLSGSINPTLCGVGIDMLEMNLQIDCPAGSGYTWTPAILLDDPAIQSPTANTITQTTTFYVTATGTCDAVDSVVVTYCDPLPVELTEFSGYNNGDANELLWSTSTQVNCDYFILQRSNEGIDFSDLAQVDGAGNSTELLEYRVTDPDPNDGITYYRLKQVDFDGWYAYSDVIAINSNNGSDIRIYPNPTTMDLFIDFNEDLDEGTQTIMISDISGKVVIEQVEFSHSQLTYKIDNFSTLKPGIYMVKVLDANNEIIKVEKITKQ